MRISDWRSDVCSSDLLHLHLLAERVGDVDVETDELAVGGDFTERRIGAFDADAHRLPLLGVGLGGAQGSPDCQRGDEDRRTELLHELTPFEFAVLMLSGTEPVCCPADRKSTRLNSSH